MPIKKSKENASLFSLPQNSQSALPEIVCLSSVNPLVCCTAVIGVSANGSGLGVVAVLLH